MSSVDGLAGVSLLVLDSVSLDDSGNDFVDWRLACGLLWRKLRLYFNFLFSVSVVESVVAVVVVVVVDMLELFELLDVFELLELLELLDWCDVLPTKVSRLSCTIMLL